VTTFDILRTNLLSPIVLAFLLGITARLIKSELSLPKDLYASLSIYLLLALGLKGGVELSESSFQAIAWPAVVTVLLGCFTPVSAYILMRKVGKFNPVDSAALAAHYGSVSAVTFIAANQFVSSLSSAAEGFMPTLVTLLESPGILLALAIGAMNREKALVPNSGLKPKTHSALLHEIFTSRSMVLLIGGLIIGSLAGAKAYEPVKPFFDTGFKGALVLFLLEMGIVAGARFADLKKVGAALVSLGIFIPIFHGTLGVILGTWAGLSVGGATVLGAMAASASYIAAPPAVRMTLPEANPTFYLTASLAITFPFNLVAGIPIYFKIASYLHG
jgi:hypothetical protein